MRRGCATHRAAELFSIRYSNGHAAVHLANALGDVRVGEWMDERQAQLLRYALAVEVAQYAERARKRADEVGRG
jgi:hypothetical protein